METTGPMQLQDTQFDPKILLMLGGHRTFGPIKIEYSFDLAATKFSFSIYFLDKKQFSGELTPNNASITRTFKAPGAEATVALKLDVAKRRITYEIKACVTTPLEVCKTFEGVLYDW